MIEILITLIGKFVPAVAGNAQLINDLIVGMQQLVPVLVKEYKDVLPLVQNIIAALQGTDGITQAQSDALDALEATIDQEFDQAAKDEGFSTDTQG